jgi:hypothetical protein
MIRGSEQGTTCLQGEVKTCNAISRIKTKHVITSTTLWEQSHTASEKGVVQSVAQQAQGELSNGEYSIFVSKPFRLNHYTFNQQPLVRTWQVLVLPVKCLTWPFQQVSWDPREGSTSLLAHAHENGLTTIKGHRNNNN